MNPIVNKNLFFIKEHAGILKAANNYDVYDPNTNEMILECREPNLGIITKIFRFTDYKRMTPFSVEVRTPSGEKVLTVKRGVSFFRSTVQVLDDKDQPVGYFRQRMLSIGGKFDVHGTNDQVLCTLQGKWTSWDFSFMREQTKLASVSKKWAGLGKELFTSADNYMLEIDPSISSNDPLRLLILGAVFCIDMVLKE